MFSDLQIVNLGLSKIGSSRIARIDPPQTSLERHVQAGYEHWKRSEITKRRWVFAREDNVVLAKVEVLEDVDKPHKYELPTNCLRPIRGKYTEWKQRGRFVYSDCDTLKVDLLLNVDEADFDPLFVEVLACRVAMECVEYVTQSNTKKSDRDMGYANAVSEAGLANAFIIGPEDIQSDDDDFPFLTARY